MARWDDKINYFKRGGDRLKDCDEAFEQQIIRLDDLEHYTRQTNIWVENISFLEGEKYSFLDQGIVLKDATFPVITMQASHKWTMMAFALSSA